MATIGIDIGGTNIRAARVDAEGRILAHRSASSSPDPSIVLERTIDLARAVGIAEAEAVGVGVPCRVDAGKRKVFSGGYVDFSGHDLFGELERRLERPVVIEPLGNGMIMTTLRNHNEVVAADTVFDDIGVGAAKTGMLFSRADSLLMASSGRATSMSLRL
jgi:glucokinase